MKKSLYELALDYDESIKMTQQIIDNVRTKISAAKKENNFDAVYSLKRDLQVLYEELSDLKITAEKLKNYYEETDRRIAI